MSVLKKLRYLLPSYRRAQEKEMQEEFESLSVLAEKGELGNLTLLPKNEELDSTYKAK